MAVSSGDNLAFHLVGKKASTSAAHSAGMWAERMVDSKGMLKVEKLADSSAFRLVVSMVSKWVAYLAYLLVLLMADSMEYLMVDVMA